jgi:hypothetical protein
MHMKFYAEALKRWEDNFQIVLREVEGLDWLYEVLGEWTLIDVVHSVVQNYGIWTEIRQPSFQLEHKEVVSCPSVWFKRREGDVNVTIATSRLRRSMSDRCDAHWCELLSLLSLHKLPVPVCLIDIKNVVTKKRNSSRWQRGTLCSQKRHQLLRQAVVARSV